jgi:hypothetical protein
MFFFTGMQVNDMNTSFAVTYQQLVSVRQQTKGINSISCMYNHFSVRRIFQIPAGDNPITCTGKKSSALIVTEAINRSDMTGIAMT